MNTHPPPLSLHVIYQPNPKCAPGLKALFSMELRSIITGADYATWFDRLVVDDPTPALYGCETNEEMAALRAELLARGKKMRAIYATLCQQQAASGFWLLRRRMWVEERTEDDVEYAYSRTSLFGCMAALLKWRIIAARDPSSIDKNNPVLLVGEPEGMDKLNLQATAAKMALDNQCLRTGGYVVASLGVFFLFLIFLGLVLR